jgi:hypothetical protein
MVIGWLTTSDGVNPGRHVAVGRWLLDLAHAVVIETALVTRALRNLRIRMRWFFRILSSAACVSKDTSSFVFFGLSAVVVAWSQAKLKTAG